jgi:uncharacterized protein YggE
MLKRLVCLSFVLSAPLLFGQLDSNSVTVTANRNVNLQPDQVLFAVYVTTPFTASLDDVLAAVKGVGITSANFSGVSSNATGTFIVGLTGTTLPATPTVQWAFGLPVPFAQMKATVTTLTGLQQSITQNNSGFSLLFSVQGTQVSATLQQAQTCSLAGLIADATAQAQKLAAAAGLNLGGILAMSSIASPAANNFVTVAAELGSLVSSQLTQPQNCTLTVKFGLTRF